MLRKIGQAIKKVLDTMLVHLQQSVRPVLKVKLTRYYLCLSLPPRFGGQFHLLPRKELAAPLHFTVAAEGQRFILQMVDATCSQITLADFSNEATARLALSKLGQALSDKYVTRWLWRLSLLCLIGWWINTNHPAQSPSLTNKLPDTAALFATEPPPPISPTGFSQPALQTNESAENLAQQIITAQANAKYTSRALPSQHASKASLLGANSDATDATSINAGCNPKFAFEVAQP